MRKNQTFRWALFLVVFSLMLAIGPVRAAVAPPLTINDGQTRTVIRRVTLKINAPKDARQMKISNDERFTDATWEGVTRQKIWYLDYGAGAKRVYIKFRDSRGKESSVSNDAIFLNSPGTFRAEFEINDDAERTNSRAVNLNFSKLSAGVEKIEVSNSSNFSDSEEFFPRDLIQWNVTPGSGEKTVYVRFIDVSDRRNVLSDSIEYEEPPRYIAEGSVLKGQSETIYYLGFDGKLHAFVDLAVYHSWYKDFSKVVYVSDAKIQEYVIGSPVCLRAGTWLVKFPHSPRIYAVEPGCHLRPIRSETEAFVFYGDTWQKRIVELSEVQRNFYTLSDLTIYERSEDRDRDGVSIDTEEFYNTSDNRSDSDADGISDYEEIYAWFSDPVKKDSNNNGVSDAGEIRKGLSPLSALPITTLPEGSYTLPVGTVFSPLPNKGRIMYYQYTPDHASSSSDSTFRTYNAPTTFISKTPFAFVLPKSSGAPSGLVKLHFTPNRYSDDTLRPL